VSEEAGVSPSVARATTLEAAGDVVGALLALEEAVEVDPEDVRAWLSLAGLRHRRGEDPAAIDAFARAANLYEARGQGLKAIAVYKQATRIAPLRDDLALALSAQYEQHGLMGEAMEQLVTAASARASRQEPLGCLELIRAALRLDPDNLEDRVRLAETLAERRRLKEACELLGEVIAQLDPQEQPALYGAAAERLAALGQGPVAVAIALAKMALADGDCARAMRQLAAAQALAPEDRRVLALVADAFEGLGQSGRAVAVLDHLARLCDEAGLADAHADALARLASLAPHHPAAGGSQRPAQGHEETLVFETAHSHAPDDG
jgi:pilus assembly protein FimV